MHSALYPFLISSLLASATPWNSKKCLITLFNSKPVFINLFHSFIYFHQQFVIAPSNPFDKFLTHSSPCRAIFTDGGMKAIDPLNTNRSIKFLCHRGAMLLRPAHSLCELEKSAEVPKRHLWVACESEVHALVWTGISIEQKNSFLYLLEKASS